MDFQPVRLDSLIRDVKMRMCGRKRSLDVELDLRAASSIQADTIRLAEVLDNLFDNSIKYAPDAKITITLRAQNKKQIITFADQGPGIPPESLPFLFERFYRVPGQSGKRGAGLGLFICKQIIQAHHGQISVKTVTGKGTTFRIELPVQQAKAS
jgi:signal transduction histidine kinase